MESKKRSFYFIDINSVLIFIKTIILGTSSGHTSPYCTCPPPLITKNGQKGKRHRRDSNSRP